MEFGFERRRSTKGTSFDQPRRCLNCGKEISHTATDLYSRRFCSAVCKEKYMSEE